MDIVSFWAALGAGIASFISPCILPMVPVYLATLAGPQILDDEDERRFRLPLFLHALCFVLGFTVIFTLLGAITGLAGWTINSYSPLARWISGGILVIMGLLMLASQYIPFFGREMRYMPKLGQTTSYLRSFLVGGAFTIAWTPCLSPILGSVLTLAMASETAWHGAFLLTVYSLGMGIPFLLIGAFFGALTPLLRRLERASLIIYHIGAAILIIVGILIIIGKIDWLYIS
ncbi:MAG: cytochrome c biogenesis CcdA family protein [Dehalococcoidia bacterium]|nr:cytochrome c biogenesis CcdA family protein [Dehalococcoidia bacterium]